MTSQEAKRLYPSDPNGKYLHIAFDLKFNRCLYTSHKKLNSVKYPIQFKTFIDTTFEEQDQWADINK